MVFKSTYATLDEAWGVSPLQDGKKYKDGKKRGDNDVQFPPVTYTAFDEYMSMYDTYESKATKLGRQQEHAQRENAKHSRRASNEDATVHGRDFQYNRYERVDQDDRNTRGARSTGNDRYDSTKNNTKIDRYDRQFDIDRYGDRHSDRHSDRHGDRYGDRHSDTRDHGLNVYHERTGNNTTDTHVRSASGDYGSRDTKGASSDRGAGGDNNNISKSTNETGTSANGVASNVVEMFDGEAERQYLNFALYIFSGIILIFVMEQFIQIGMALRRN